jgi:signal peptidase II
MRSNNIDVNNAKGAQCCAPCASHVRRNAVLFACVVLAFLLVDRLTKMYFDAAALGSTFDGAGLFGLVSFVLVHNTGGAWGIFSGNTFALGLVALVFCAFVLVYLFVLARDSSALSTVALGMIFAGGIGNMIDRFLLGYVVDFLNFTFIDFPVFNVADIGVTCGVVLFLLSIILDARTGQNEDAGQNDAALM